MTDKKKTAPDIGVSESGAQGYNSQLHSTTAELDCKDPATELMKVFSELSPENRLLLLYFARHIRDDGFLEAYDAELLRQGVNVLSPDAMYAFIVDWEEGCGV